MPAANRFWDRMAKSYSRKPVPDQAVYERKLAITRDFFHPGMDVLEIGCGSGLTAISHAPYVHHILGIDSSRNMIAIADENARRANVANTRFEQATVEAFAAGEEQFDAVLALSVLHLLDDWLEVIEKIHRMLKPGGVFVSSTACIADINPVLKLALRAGGKTGFIPTAQFIAPDELTQALQATGFTIKEHWQPDDGRTSFIVASRNL